VVPLEVSQLAKPLLSRSLKQVDRTCKGSLCSLGATETTALCYPETFQHQSRHTGPEPRRRDSLAIGGYCTSAGSTRRRGIRWAAVLGSSVTVRIISSFPLKTMVFGLMTDGHEYASREIPEFPGLRITQVHALDVGLGAKIL